MNISRSETKFLTVLQSTTEPDLYLVVPRGNAPISGRATEGEDRDWYG